MPTAPHACRSMKQGMKALAIVINATACGAPAVYTAAQVESFYWDVPAQAAMLSKCSYGRSSIDRAAFKVLTVNLPCTIPDAYSGAPVSAVQHSVGRLLADSLGNWAEGACLPPSKW